MERYGPEWLRRQYEELAARYEKESKADVIAALKGLSYLARCLSAVNAAAASACRTAIAERRCEVDEARTRLQLDQAFAALNQVEGDVMDMDDGSAGGHHPEHDEGSSRNLDRTVAGIVGELMATGMYERVVGRPPPDGGAELAAHIAAQPVAA